MAVWVFGNTCDHVLADAWFDIIGADLFMCCLDGNQRAEFTKYLQIHRICAIPCETKHGSLVQLKTPMQFHPSEYRRDSRQPSIVRKSCPSTLPSARSLNYGCLLRCSF